jgi:hypothetical protein
MVGNINKRLHNLTSTIKAIQAQRLVDPVNGRLGALDICPDTTTSAYRSSL